MNNIEQLVVNPKEFDFFGDFVKNYIKTPNAKVIMDFMMEIDSIVNFFDYHKTDSLFEIMWLSVLPEFIGKSIGKEMFAASIELARELKNGKSLELLPLKLRSKRPQAAVACFSSKYSKKIGEQLNFFVHDQLYHKNYTFNGKNFMDRISDPEQYSTTLVSLAL